MFDSKQRNIEHSADFLETLTNWKNIFPEKATCYIFIHSVTKDIDKQSCVRFLQEGKSDLQELKNPKYSQLTRIFVVFASMGAQG